MTKERFKAMAWATLAVTLAVILWGAFVRATGSGAGCGSHWPTCNGEVIPRPKSVATIIEFTHRLTSGAVFLMALLQVVWAYRAFPKRDPVRAGAAATMFFMVTEALVGAALVLFQYVADDKSIARAAWMALHLVNTFLLIAASTCTAWWASGGRRARLSGQGLTGALVVAGALGSIAVGISGAITALGDTLFAASSLAQGIAADLSPVAHFLQRLRVIHPILAVFVAVFLLYARGAIAAKRPDPQVRRLSTALAVLLVAQLGLGLVNLLLLAPVFMQIVHLLFADLVWITFVLLSAAALAEGAVEPVTVRSRGAAEAVG